MCGLVGLAGDSSGNWKDVFTNLLVVDSLRGAHSTGMAAVKRFQDEISLVKQPGGPHSLFSNPDYRTILNQSVKVLIGHNRYATLGEHTEANSHPFKFDKVVGAHNGTLDISSIKLLHGNERFGTDSEAIYCNLNEHGLRNTVDKLRGAWALTWFDRTTNTVNLLRNDKRPLWYAYSKDECTLMWASEADMLDFVVKRANNRLYKDEIYSCESNIHYSWVIPDSINKKFPVPTKVEMKAPPPPPPVYTSYYTGGGNSYDYSSNWKGRHNGGGDGTSNVVPFHTESTPTGGTKSTPGTSEFRVKKDTLKFRPPYKEPGTGKIINKKDFNRITANGCAFCSCNDIEWGEFIHVLRTIDGFQAFLCEECYNDDDIFTTCQSIL